MPRNFRNFPSTWENDIAACRALLAAGSRSFFAASLLLPRCVREPATALYAFCRIADDSIDAAWGSPQSIERVRERLERLYRGSPLNLPVDRALATVVERHRIPSRLFEALFDGLEWDAAGRRYANLSELHAYASRVAGSVGVMVALLMGVRGPEVLGRAADLGVAMQLTNVARDVGEDARAKRLYLPLDWLSEAGIEADAWLARPKYTPELGVVVARILDAAETLYQRADLGIGHLPAGCRVGITAARLFYAEIGHQLRRDGLDSVSRRTVVPVRRKAALLVRAAVVGRASATSYASPCAEQTRYLIEAAVAGMSGAMPLAAAPAWWQMHRRAVWVIDLFDRLHRRQWGENVPEALAEATV